MTRATSTGRARRLPPRDPKGGRPTQEIAALLGVHILDVALEQFIASIRYEEAPGVQRETRTHPSGLPSSLQLKGLLGERDAMGQKNARK